MAGWPAGRRVRPPRRRRRSWRHPHAGRRAQPELHRIRNICMDAFCTRAAAAGRAGPALPAACGSSPWSSLCTRTRAPSVRCQPSSFLPLSVSSLPTVCSILNEKNQISNNDLNYFFWRSCDQSTLLRNVQGKKNGGLRRLALGLAGLALAQCRIPPSATPPRLAASCVTATAGDGRTSASRPLPLLASPRVWRRGPQVPGRSHTYTNAHDC